jgi:hypothetical protein
MPLRCWGRPVQFPVQSKGEWLTILRLKVVATAPLERPCCFAPDCMRAGQAKSEKYLRRMSSSKGEWPAIFRRFVPMLCSTTSATWFGTNCRFHSFNNLQEDLG